MVGDCHPIGNAASVRHLRPDRLQRHDGDGGSNGLIVAVFMHMRWERLALIHAILLPPLAVLVLVGLMAAEGDYTYFTRGEFFGGR
ncbi:MAG: hypothetical protein OHK0044_31630 [Burkholderiaceae bacterium]